MTLGKIFQKSDNGFIPFQQLIRQNNPFKTAEELYLKAGLSQEEAREFQKKPEHFSIVQLNRILAFCEFDLKLTALFDDDLEEVSITDELSDVNIKEDMGWNEETDWEEEMEEDVF